MKRKKKKKSQSGARKKPGNLSARAAETVTLRERARRICNWMSSPAVRPYVAMAFIALTVVLVFGQNITFDYIRGDPARMVFQNPHVMSGLTPENVYWAFTQPNLSMYQPLPNVSFMLDSDIFGDWPGGYHIVTTAWHALAMSLFFLVMYRLTGNFAAVFAATLLMSVHPVQVLAVSKIMPRNEIMQGVFMLLCLEGYRRYVTQGSRRAYLFSLLCMFLGLLCKQLIVMIPVGLLLLDYWPLRRVTLSFRAPRETLRAVFKLVVEKAPYFALSLVGAAFAVYGKLDMDVLAAHISRLTLVETAYYVVTGYARYLGHLVYPVRIGYFSIFDTPPSWPLFAVSAVVLVVITALSLALLRKRPYVAVGWCWFVFFMLPVSGVVRYMVEAIALRYLYVPAMGLYLAVCFGLYDLAVRRRSHEPSEAAGMPLWYWATVAMVTATLAALCVWQQHFYKGTEEMAERLLVIMDGHSPLGHNMLANVRREQGLIEQSNMHFREVIAHAPDHPLGYFYYADALVDQKRFDEALEVAEEALKDHPDQPNLLGLCGVVLMNTERYEDAESYLRRAVAVEPENTRARHNLAYCLALQRKFDEARMHVDQVLTLMPEHPLARALLERLDTAQGRI